MLVKITEKLNGCRKGVAAAYLSRFTCSTHT